MPPIRHMSHHVDGTRPSIISIHPTFTLKRLYAHTPFANAILAPFVRFPPLSGPCINLLEHPEINDPKYIDLDAGCFMMLTRDLPTLFGIMTRPTNRKVSVRDLQEFDDWLHVISNPIVVKVYVGSDEHERATFKDELVNILC